MSDLKMRLEIDLEQFVDMDSLEENIINRMADVAMSTLTGGHTASFHKMAVDAINRAIEDRLSARVEDLLSRPIPAVDRFGDATGEEPKTLAQMLSEAADDAMTQTVDRSGKPEKRTAYNSAVPRLEYLVKKVAAEGIADAAAKTAKKVNEEAKGYAQKVLANAVAAQLARMAK